MNESENPKEPPSEPNKQPKDEITKGLETQKKIMRLNKGVAKRL